MDSREYTKRLVKETNTRLGSQIGELELRSHIGKKLDVGAFTISAPITSTSVDTVLPLDTISYGNLTLSDNGGIILAPYKRYRITAFAVLNNTITGTYNIVLRMKNITDGTYLPFMTNTARGSSNCENVIETTETTEIQIVNNSGTSTTINNLYVVVQEIGREVILDPAEDAKNLEFDKAVFMITSDISDSSIIVGQPIPFDSTIYNSGSLTLSNGKVKLKPNTEYKISANILIQGSNINACLKDFTNNIVISKYLCCFGTNVNNPASTQPRVETYYRTGNTECEIGLNVSFKDSLIYLKAGYCYLTVEEVAHPYYFNYYKDSIGSKVLFDGEATTVGTYDLLDDINNYEWVTVVCGQLWGSGQYSLIEERNVTVSRIQGTANEYSYNQYSSNSERTIYFHFDKTNNKLSIDGLVQPSGGTYKKMGVVQVIGYGFIYDNPYQDLISSGSSSIETTEEEMNNLTSF